MRDAHVHTAPTLVLLITWNFKITNTVSPVMASRCLLKLLIGSQVGMFMKTL
jgi:hypothetical protein